MVVVRLLAPEDIPPAAVEGMHLGAGQGSPPVGDTHPEGDMHSEAEGDNPPEAELDSPPEAELDSPPEAEWGRQLQLPVQQDLLFPGLK